jgi:hypothetical protein
MMTVLADLLVAEAGDIPSITASEYPLGEFKGVNVDGLDPLTLAALHADLSGEVFETLLEKFHPVAEASPNGPWLIRFPPDFVGRLAEFSPPDYPNLAQRWLATTQVGEVGWPQDVAERFVGQIVYFAQNASFEGKELFLWVYS